MRRTEVFRLQHAELAGHADRLEAMLTVSALKGAESTVREALGVFAGILAIHAAQEDDKLYPMLFNHANPQVRSEARQLHADFGIIYAAVEVFLAVWSREGALEEEPKRFIDEATGLIGTLRQRIARENDELYARIDAF